MRHALGLVIVVCLIPSCQQDIQQGSSKSRLGETRPSETEPTWSGARPIDWEYRQRVADARRRGMWPPVKERKYRLYVFQDQKWRGLALLDSIDSADALRKAVKLIPEADYDQPIAIVPADAGLPPISSSGANVANP